MTKVTVQSIGALTEFNSALSRFTTEAQSSLRTMEQQLRKMEEWLTQRENHWRAEVVRRTQAHESAQVALRYCQLAGRSTCREERSAVQRAARALEEAKAELRTAQHYRNEVTSFGEGYRVRARKHLTFLETDLHKARITLYRTVGHLQGYTEGAAGTEGLGQASPTQTSNPFDISNATAADMTRAIFQANRIRLGQIAASDLPSAEFGSTQFGYSVQEQVADTVRRAFPDVEFLPTLKRGVEGPDMLVANASSSDFDWIEIKPNTESGVNTFVQKEWGKSEVWSGRGRIAVYDPDGTVSLIDHELLAGA